MFQEPGIAPENRPEYEKRRFLADTLLTKDSSRTLEKIILGDSIVPITNLLQQVQDLAGSLPNVLDQIDVAAQLSDCVNDFNRLSTRIAAHIEDPTFESRKYSLYLKLSKKFHNLIDTFEKIFSREPDDDSSKEDSNLSNLLRTYIARYCFSFHYSNEEESQRTNISLVVRSTAQNNGTIFSNDYLTPISSHLIRAMIMAIIKEQLNFFNKLTTEFTSHTTVSLFRSALKDEDFKKTRLSKAISAPILEISQDGYDINIKRMIPDALFSFAQRNYSDFTRSLNPMKEMLKEINGDLFTSFDKIKKEEESEENECISVTISCPMLEYSELDFEKKITDEDINDNISGQLPLIAIGEVPIIGLKRDYDKEHPDTKVTLKTIPEFIIQKKLRNGLASALSLLPSVDKNNSIDKIVTNLDEKHGYTVSFIYLSRYIDGKEPNSDVNAPLVVSANALTKDNIQALRSIVHLSNCEEIRLLGDKESVQSQLAAINGALQKAAELASGPFSLKYHYPDFNEKTGEGFIPALEIRDSDGFLIINANYNAEVGEFTGRFHKAELTKKAIAALEELFAIDNLTSEEPYLDINDDFFIEKLAEKFRKQNVLLTDSFKALIHVLAISDKCGNINELRAELMSIICNKIMSIDEDGERIILDVPEPFIEGHKKYFEKRVI